MTGFLRPEMGPWAGFGKEELKFSSVKVGLKPFRCWGGQGMAGSNLEFRGRVHPPSGHGSCGEKLLDWPGNPSSPSEAPELEVSLGRRIRPPVPL